MTLIIKLTWNRQQALTPGWWLEQGHESSDGGLCWPLVTRGAQPPHHLPKHTLVLSTTGWGWRHGWKDRERGERTKREDESEVERKKRREMKQNEEGRWNQSWLLVLVWRYLWSAPLMEKTSENSRGLRLCTCVYMCVCVSVRKQSLVLNVSIRPSIWQVLLLFFFPFFLF